MNYIHGTRINHYGENVVILLDKIVTDLSLLEDHEFIFAEYYSNELDKEIYFVANFDDYHRLKDDNVSVVGFWHWLYISNIVNFSKSVKVVADTSIYYIVIDENKEIQSGLQIPSQLMITEIDTGRCEKVEVLFKTLADISKIFTPDEKKRESSKGKFIISLVHLFVWVLISGSIYLYYYVKKSEENKVVNNINDIQVKIKRGKLFIDKIKEDKIQSNSEFLINHLNSLWFLYVNNIQIKGNVDFDHKKTGKVTTEVDIDTLRALLSDKFIVKDYFNSPNTIEW